MNGSTNSNSKYSIKHRKADSVAENAESDTMESKFFAVPGIQYVFYVHTLTENGKQF